MKLILWNAQVTIHAILLHHIRWNPIEFRQDVWCKILNQFPLL